MVTIDHQKLAGMLLKSWGWVSCSSTYMTEAVRISSTSMTVSAASSERPSLRKTVVTSVRAGA